MRLTDFTDYALRVLMYLSVHDRGLNTIGQIAARYGISESHLSKVAWELGCAGFIHTVRGKGGGLRLARSPKAISVGEVARRMERTILFAECAADRSGACRIAPCCELKNILIEAEAAFNEVLDGYTVDDLLRRNWKLREILSIEPLP